MENHRRRPSILLLVLTVAALTIASAIAVRGLVDAGLVEVHSGDFTSIVTLTVLAILMIFIIPLPLVVWLNCRIDVDNLQKDVRREERTRKYNSVVRGFLAPSAPSSLEELLKDGLVDALRNLCF